MQINKATALLSVGLYSAIITPVEAVGFIVTPPSKLTGMANAGSAIYNQSTAVVSTNPAAMSLLSSEQVSGNFTTVIPDWQVNEGWQCEVDVNCADSNVGPIAFIPTLGYVKPVNDQLTYGIALGAIAGSGFEYGDKWRGRTLVTENGLQIAGITNAFSFRLNERVSLGLGLGVIYGRFHQDLDLPSLSASAGSDIANVITFVGLAQECSGPPALIRACRLAALQESGLDPESASETLVSIASYLGGEQGAIVELKGDDFGTQVNIGVTYSIDENNRIGFTYHLNPNLEFDGDATIYGQLLSDDIYQRNQTYLTWDLPNRAILSGHHKINHNTEFFWDFERVFFDIFEENEIHIDHYPTISLTRNFKDANRYAIGAQYNATSKYTFQFGLSYDESPVDDGDRNPDIPLDTITKVALGVINKWDEHLELHAYTNIEFLGDASIEQLTVINGHKIGSSITLDYDPMIYVVGFSATYKF